MLKYWIIAGIFGWGGLYSFWGVLQLGLGAIAAADPVERRFCLGLGIWWLGVAVICMLITAAALWRIAALRRLSRSTE
jgi:hypothetical protein